jgi:hypothetical protein
MGNYKDIETEFIERTLMLISQYEKKMPDYKFEEQFNHTLLINCLLGLIVFPKEKIISYLPKQDLTDKKVREEMGIFHSKFNPDIKDLKQLLIALRHSIAHFNISFESLDKETFLIDRIVFKDIKDKVEVEIAMFMPNELLCFVRYYGGWLLHNLRHHRGV